MRRWLIKSQLHAQLGDSVIKKPGDAVLSIGGKDSFPRQVG